MCPHRILYPVKISFKHEGEIKMSSNITKAKSILHQQICTTRNDKKSFRQMENDTKWKSKSIQRNKERHKFNTWVNM